MAARTQKDPTDIARLARAVGDQERAQDNFDLGYQGHDYQGRVAGHEYDNKSAVTRTRNIVKARWAAVVAAGMDPEAELAAYRIREDRRLAEAALRLAEMNRKAARLRAQAAARLADRKANGGVSFVEYRATTTVGTPTITTLDIITHHYPKENE